MTRQQVTLTGRQLAALGLVAGLTCAAGVVRLAGGPFWLAAVVAGLIALVLVPLTRSRNP